MWELQWGGEGLVELHIRATRLHLQEEQEGVPPSRGAWDIQGRPGCWKGSKVPGVQLEQTVWPGVEGSEISMLVQLTGRGGAGSQGAAPGWEGELSSSSSA